VPLDVPQYSNIELERVAEALHSEYCDDPVKPPIDIEVILERMGAEIIPLPNLARDHGVVGLLSRSERGDQFAVFVDARVCEEQETRYRFTVAEECAHMCLHASVYENVHTLAAATRFYLGLTGDEHWVLDRNAKYLAGAILIPSSHVKQIAPEIVPPRLDTMTFVSDTHILGEAAKILAEVYNVSGRCMLYRLDNKAIRLDRWLLDRYRERIL